MQNKGLWLFSLLTAVVVVATVMLSKRHAPQTSLERSLLFPQFAERINDVYRIELIDSEIKPVILQRQEDQWVVVSADNYPARLDLIRQLVFVLSELKVLAKKTDNPGLYSNLGVEDPGVGSGTAVLLTVSDRSNTVLASLIVGKPRTGSQGGNVKGIYVRRPEDKYALLVSDYMQPKAMDNEWYDRDLLDLPKSRIKQVELSYSDQHFSMAKDEVGEAKFTVTEGQVGDPDVALDKLATFLQDLRADGVKVADGVSFPGSMVNAVFKTFNGLVVGVKAYQEDADAFAVFSVTNMVTKEKQVDPLAATSDTGTVDSNEIEAGDAVAEDNKAIIDESRRLGERLHGWVYKIPQFKFDGLKVDIEAASK